MATEAQIAANRRNALKSTGPRTAEGKAKASRNALKHGLLSRDVVIAGEDAEEFAALREGMMAELVPEGALEWLLADRVVTAAWRLRRATRLERDVVEGRVAARLRAQERSPQIYAGEPEPTPARMAAWTLEQTDTFGKISRYEAHIERGMYRALHELQRRQAARCGGPVTPSLAVDAEAPGARAPAQERVSAKQSQSGAVEPAPTPAAGSFSAKQSQSSAEEPGPAPAARAVSAKQSQSAAGRAPHDGDAAWAETGTCGVGGCRKKLAGNDLCRSRAR